MTTENADVLDKAADLIDPDNGGRWIRGAFSDGDGGYCIVGAVGHVMGLPLSADTLWPTAPIFTETHALLVGVLGENPAIWNDEECLDGADAANVLRKAAEIERQEVAR
jgi:hypothetical protein